jgi:hypothetical protein
VIQALDDLGVAQWARDGIVYAWNVERGASA